MTSEHLGATIDIHGGGQDLIFPHHEAECAQSECYHHAPLARYWVHNAMVLSDGQKMSKSLGNFITVADVLEKHPGRSEEHTSELQSLMRISYAVFCLKKKNKKYENN